MQAASAIADNPLVSIPLNEKKTPIATPNEADETTAAPTTESATAITLISTPTSIEPPRLSESLSALNKQFLAGNSAMQKFFAQLSKPAWLTAPASAPSPLKPSTDLFSSEQTYRSQRFENQLSLQLTTKEGDHISVRLFSAANAQQSSSQINSADKLISTQRDASQTQTSFSYAVEGELNAQELTAIDDYVQSLSQAVSSFFNDDLDAAVQALANASLDTQQISSVDFRLQSKAIATYTRTYQAGSGIPPQTPAWQKLDQYFNEVLMQQTKLPKAWEKPFIEQLLPILDWYQINANAKSAVQLRESHNH